MTAPPINYDTVADLYDTYVQCDFDIPFWTSLARAAHGPSLELMCGTGRIALRLLGQGIPVEGLDASAGMIAVFRRKLSQAGLSATLHHASAVTFSAPGRYSLIFLAFNSISEILDDADKLLLLENTRRNLAPGGQFWITIHNPPVRSATLDGRLVEVARAPLPNGAQLRVTSACRLDESSGIASGVQVYEVSGQSQPPRRIELPIRFHLIPPAHLEESLASAGFAITERLGSYDSSPFRAERSPFLIVGCRPARATTRRSRDL